jgi:hypothetical protein
MTKKRWRDDGPRMSTGWRHDWRYLQTILLMSARHKKNWDDVFTLRKFFTAHPDLVPTRRELENVPAEKIVAHLQDLQSRQASEQARRRAAAPK